MPGHRVLRFPDADTLADLATFVGRAKRADPDGAARLVGHGDVLAVYVSPVHGGGGPVVLGLRTVRLALADDLDVTVSLAALGDRFARIAAVGPGPAGPSLAVPPAEVAGVSWAGMSPPRRGWEGVGALDVPTIAAGATAGIAEVATGTPAGAGAAAVATLRARVWGRPLVEELPDLPAGVAFAVHALGFLDLDDDTPAAVYRRGPWWRVTTARGHVLARRPAIL